MSAKFDKRVPKDKGAQTHRAQLREKGMQTPVRTYTDVVAQTEGDVVIAPVVTGDNMDIEFDDPTAGCYPCSQSTYCYCYCTTPFC